MSKRITARHARKIRIGINARCLPYVEGGNESHGYYTVADFARIRQHELDWVLEGQHSKLARRAYDRTKVWVSTRQEQR